MTTQQLHLFNALYLAMTIIIAVWTRATARRVAGALAGSAAMGVAALGIIVLGERAGWWQMAIRWDAPFLLLLFVDLALCAYVFLITWRIARRFGARGLVVVAVIAALIGPPRDHWCLSRFPEWGRYGPGIAPILAVAGADVGLGVVVGHDVMRLIAGPAKGSALARRPWESVDSSDAAGPDRRARFWDFSTA